MKKLTLKVISLIVFVCMAVSVFSSCGEEKKSKDAGDYLKKIIEKSFPESEAKPQYNSAMTEIIYNPTESDPLGIGLNVKSYANVFGEAVSIIKLNGSDSSLDLSVYSGGESVIVASDIFPHKAYGMTVSEFEAVLDSLGAYGSEDMPDMNMANPFVGANINAVIGAFENNAEDIEKIAEKYLEFFEDCVNEATEESVTEDEGITVEIRFNSDCAKKFIKDIFTEMKKDKELKQLFKDILNSSQLPKDEVDGILSEYDAMFESDEFLDGIFDEINENFFSVSFKVEADKEYNAKNVLLSLDLENGSSYKLELDITSKNNVSLKVAVTENIDGQAITVQTVYSIKTEEDSEKLNGEIKIETSIEGQKTSVTYKLDWNKVSEDYKVSVLSPYQTLTAEGKMKIGEKSESITVTKIDITEETFEADGPLTYSFDLDVKINTVKDEKLPAFPTEYKGILELTQEEIDEIMETLSEHSVIGLIMDMIMGTPDYDEDFENSFDDFYDDMYEDYDDFYGDF